MKTIQLFALAVAVAAAPAVDADFSKFALTDTGSIGGGKTFPGVVSRPFGMVKLGPDLSSGTDAYSGYLTNGNFTGFSMLHESGTGGAPKYGVVSQMPVVGKIDDPLVQNTNDSRAEPDHTEVGYDRAKLGSGTAVELAATTKASLLQYSFPKTNKALNISIEATNGIHAAVKARRRKLIPTTDDVAGGAATTDWSQRITLDTTCTND